MVIKGHFKCKKYALYLKGLLAFCVCVCRHVKKIDSQSVLVIL